MAKKKPKITYNEKGEPISKRLRPPVKKKSKRIWDVPLKDLQSETKKRVKRRVEKVKKKIGDTTLKDVGKGLLKTTTTKKAYDLTKKGVQAGTKIYKEKKEKRRARRQAEYEQWKEEGGKYSFETQEQARKRIERDKGYKHGGKFRHSGGLEQHD